MSLKFFQTIMGQRFIEGTVPAVLSQIKRLNENLERMNINLEMLLDREAAEETREENE